MEAKEKIIVFGASGHGKVIMEILQSMGHRELAVWDDQPAGFVLGYEVVKPDQKDTARLPLLIAVGDNAARKKLVSRFSDIHPFSRAIHPSVITSPSAEIGEGTVVMAGVVMNAEVKIGRHVIVNTSASIDHECLLGDFVHVSPNATLCGRVEIGEGTHVGAGSVIVQNIKVGKWCRIGAGAVVIQDVPDYCTVVGNPGRVIKQSLK